MRNRCRHIIENELWTRQLCIRTDEEILNRVEPATRAAHGEQVAMAALLGDQRQPHVQGERQQERARERSIANAWYPAAGAP
jgi:hypothetical protein